MKFSILALFLSLCFFAHATTSVVETINYIEIAQDVKECETDLTFKGSTGSVELLCKINDKKQLASVTTPKKSIGFTEHALLLGDLKTSKMNYKKSLEAQGFKENCEKSMTIFPTVGNRASLIPTFESQICKFTR